jgi:predicted DNA binding CopG/RHH family protein
MELDDEEKEILDAYESGQLELRAPAPEELAAIKAAADNTFKKDRRITIRLYEHDYKVIQKKGLEMGIPYQTLISGIIHRYIEGDLVSSDN